MQIALYFDPVCPWCWVTARWLMNVRENRTIEIDWRPFSLALKNEGVDQPERWQAVQREGLRSLRVVEAARVVDGPEAVERLYVEMSRRWHHDGERRFNFATILDAAGVDGSIASAADDPSWNVPIEAAMVDLLAVVGEDVGVPAVVFEGDDPIGFYGPIIAVAPAGEEAERLLDHILELARLPGFFELKRGRDGRPQPGNRP